MGMPASAFFYELLSRGSRSRSWGSWKDCLYSVTSLFVAAFSGLEDVPYYARHRKPMLEAFPRLDGKPMIYHSTREGVIFSLTFWLFSLTVLYDFLYWQRNKVPQPVSE